MTWPAETGGMLTPTGGTTRPYEPRRLDSRSKLLTRTMPGRRPAGLWEDNTDHMDDDEENDNDAVSLNGPKDGATSDALDGTIDRIGMGRYHWRLYFLCGSGWLSDNMWLQTVSVCIPRVQIQFGLSSSASGLMGSSVFAGLMCGAVAWGVVSDHYGRLFAFRLTLLMASISGVVSAFTPNFPLLCLCLFLVGIGVGGDMPCAGALLLEFIPRKKQYLLTFLSIFFSLGAILTSVISLVVMPGNSCPVDERGQVVQCDLAVQNRGWRYQLASTGAVTLVMLLCRFFLFRLMESPKFLVNKGRPDEALAVLRHVCHVNALDLTIHQDDVVNSIQANGQSNASSRSLVYDADSDEESEAEAGDESTPTRVRPLRSSSYKALPRKTVKPSKSTRFRDSPLDYLKEHTESVQPLFSDKWRLTTFLVWAIWICSSIAYTTFNTFLPYLLEQRNASMGAEGQNESLWEYFIYAVSGLPGSVIAAWMIETRLGRRYSMALSTAGNALFLFAFTAVDSRIGVMVSSGLVSLLSTIMYAVIYGYTPEVFESEVRGTAAGIAAGLARLFSIITPITTGFLVGISLSLPLYFAVTVYLVCAGCMWSLPIETRGR